MLMNIVVSIPLRKFRKREGYHNENKTRPVSIPLRKFRKQQLLSASKEDKTCFHPSKEV